MVLNSNSDLEPLKSSKQSKSAKACPDKVYLHVPQMVNCHVW